MLVKAEYQGTKIVTTHAQRIDHYLDFSREMNRVDGKCFSKSGTMRWAGRIPTHVIAAYEKENPGFSQLIYGHTGDWKLRDRAIRKFMKSDIARRFTWGSI